jgi:transcriptional regulator with XRE-family HTH domain
MEVYDFGLLLKELREKHKLTQKQLSEKLGVMESAVSSYERNISQPTIDTLKTLSVLYRVKTDYLLGMKEHKSLITDGLTEKQLEILQAIIEEIKK